MIQLCVGFICVSAWLCRGRPCDVLFNNYEVPSYADLGGPAAR